LISKGSSAFEITSESNDEASDDERSRNFRMSLFAGINMQIFHTHDNMEMVGDYRDFRRGVSGRSSSIPIVEKVAVRFSSFSKV
jgi:hypothetical protein